MSWLVTLLQSEQFTNDISRYATGLRFQGYLNVECGAREDGKKVRGLEEVLFI